MQRTGKYEANKVTMRGKQMECVRDGVGLIRFEQTIVQIEVGGSRCCVPQNAKDEADTVRPVPALGFRSHS